MVANHRSLPAGPAPNSLLFEILQIAVMDESREPSTGITLQSMWLHRNSGRTDETDHEAPVLLCSLASIVRSVTLGNSCLLAARLAHF